MPWLRKYPPRGSMRQRMRAVQLHLTEAEYREVTRLAKERGDRKNDLIREAVGAYLRTMNPEGLRIRATRAFGIWKETTEDHPWVG